MTTTNASSTKGVVRFGAVPEPGQLVEVRRRQWVEGCRSCKRRHDGRCVFECFRRDTELARLRVASMKV